MKRAPIAFGAWSFPTQKALAAHIRAIRDRYPNGERLNADDSRFMYELLRARHPDFKWKVARASPASR